MLKIIKKCIVFALCAVLVLSISASALADRDINLDPPSFDFISLYNDVVSSDLWRTAPQVERVAALQIPAEILNAMPTSSLVHAVAKYPFLTDILAFDSAHQGFLRQAKECAALHELLMREDAPAELLAYYSSVRVATGNSSDDANDVGDLWAFEKVISQPEFMNSMSSEQVVELFEIAEKKYQEKIERAHGSIAKSFYESVSESTYSAEVSRTITTYVQTSCDVLSPVNFYTTQKINPVLSGTGDK